MLKEQYGTRFAYAVGNVSNRDDVKQAVDQALSMFQHIDILLNTAGILDGFAKTLETDEALWDRIMDTNVKGMYVVTNAILPSMLQRKSGVIVNMASIAGLVAGGEARLIQPLSMPLLAIRNRPMLIIVARGFVSMRLHQAPSKHR